MQRSLISALLTAALNRARQGPSPVSCIQGDTSMFAWGRKPTASLCSASQAAHLDSCRAEVGHPVQDAPAHHLDSILTVGIEDNGVVGHLQQQTMPQEPEAMLGASCCISRHTGGLSKVCGLRSSFRVQQEQ